MRPRRTSLPTTYVVEPISAQRHEEFIASRADSDEISFLQTPSWGLVKPDWRHESIGFFAGDELVGAALVLYRNIPKSSRCLAYLPEGPILDWRRVDTAAAVNALVNYAATQKAFAVRIGPTLVHRRWYASTIKNAIADERYGVLSDVSADEVDLDAVRLSRELYRLGWIPPKEKTTGFQSGQPRFNFMLPLDGKSCDEVLKGMNQLWRRNIKRAAKLGVEVRRGDRNDLAAFHKVYLETAERDHFTGRPLHYFETMWDALNADGVDRMRVYLAKYQGQVIAATTWIKVNRHCWYSYGASTTEHRQARGSNAVQWQMIQDAIAEGASVYDLRGITEGITDANPELGLIQFKVGTGGQATAFIGEWDYPINPLIYRAFSLYMNRG